MEPDVHARRAALAGWGLLALGGAVYGRGLALAAGSWGVALPEPVAALAGAALAVAMVHAAAFLLWLPLSWRVRLRRRGVARALALAFGLSLLGGAACDGSLAAVLTAGAGVALCLLWTAVGAELLYALPGAAALLAAGFGLPALLFARLGPLWGLAAAVPAALAGAVLLAAAAWPPRRFLARVGPALWPAALATAAGTAWHGFVKPVALYRTAGLSPRAVVGVDGQGGCFVRNRTGEVFHARADGAWERLPLPAGLRLGRVAEEGAAVLALEIRPEGDRLWRVEGATAAAAALGRASGDIVFVADYAVDGETPVAVDALGARLVWTAPDGRILRAVYPPAEAGAPRLVAASGGAVHVYTESGAILRLLPRGGWSVLRVPPPPGRPMALSEEDGRYVVAAREAGGRTTLYALTQGVAGRWKELGVAGRWPRLATDGRRSFILDGTEVSAAPLPGGAGSARALGPSASLTSRFNRTPAGALLRLVE